MSYSAITIQGNILSGDILEKIRLEDTRYQKAADFGLDRDTSVRDEIGIAWGATRAHWKAFQLRRERLKDTDSGTSETRQSWIIPFLRELGYDLEKSTAAIVNEKTYAISHRATQQDGFPVHVEGINRSLDKRAESGGPRLSPHALVQEYLNNTEHLYAIVTNGRFLRLLRDATRLSKLSYLEFDLQRIMEEELFAEFALLFRVLHATRMPTKRDDGENAIIEFYHQEALASGSRIRERLSVAVEESLKILANGLLKHPDNQELRRRIQEGNLSSAEYYLYLLRLVYRILFLLVIEERQLVYPEERDTALDKKRTIYYQFYSVSRLTRLVKRFIYVDARKTDLWQSLLVTFRLFESESIGAKLGIRPLGSGLFSPSALDLLSNAMLDNDSLLKVLRHLVTFENDNQQLVRVNYADLDVEEFGSVYEGLLDYDPEVQEINGQPVFSFVSGTGRSSSGSHYTPEELVKPLIEHSLDHIIEDCIKKPAERLPGTTVQATDRALLQEQTLLAIKVADVACGSGHILLSAARRIALELARVRTQEDQPAPTAIRQATRDVIRHCIYGVDKNPLAVELCKVALWLEAHHPGEPLSFLDHHIKCGDAIVGLAHKDELQRGIDLAAFKAMPGDEKTVASAYAKRNREERKAYEKTVASYGTPLTTEYDEKVQQELLESLKQFSFITKLTENTPAEIENKRKAYERWLGGSGYMFLKNMADVQTAQFFYPKTQAYKDYLVTDEEYRRMLKGLAWTGQKAAKATAEAFTRRFFHWFLEFPEVIENGGFDCILGNPPFLGGQKVSTVHGKHYLNHIHASFPPAKGTADIVAYFFRRAFALLDKGGFQSLISTNTIAQGDTRVGGLAAIMNTEGTINHAVRSMRWPGLAAVEVALVTVYKGGWGKSFTLDQKAVQKITTYLDDAEVVGNPYKLVENENKSFIGSYVLGMGFVLEPKEAEQLIRKNSKNKEVLFPYLNGQDLNSRPDQSPSRWVINFFNWPLRLMSIEEWKELKEAERKRVRKRLREGKVEPLAPPEYEKSVAADYPDCLQIIERLVKLERKKLDPKKSSTNLKRNRYWWHYGAESKNLYHTIADLNKVMVHTIVTKTHAVSYSDTNAVFAHRVVVFALEENAALAVLQSDIHNHWAWKYSSTMKSDRNYSPSDCFQTFPFPESAISEQHQKLEELGEAYHGHRKQLMLDQQEGLTTTYNRFHNPEEDNAAHIQLRELHQQMDEAVLRAYGWEDLIEQTYPLAEGKYNGTQLHDFYEVDYLPENDRVRYTLHPEARREVLKRLLLLNHKRYEEEIRQGLHKKKDAEAFYTQKGEEMPEAVKALYAKGAKKPKQKTLALPEEKDDSTPVSAERNKLFIDDETSSPQRKEVSLHSRVVVTNRFTNETRHYIIVADIKNSQTEIGYEPLTITSQLALAMLNRKVGSKFALDRAEYEVLEIK